MRYGVFAEELQREVPAWVREGLVTTEQADALLRRYAGEAVRDRRRTRVVQVLGVIGAIVAGLGVILFFAANWDAISRPLRVVVLLLALLGAYAAGFRALSRRPAAGQALLLLGAIAFGASIFLVGQMYHVQAHDPLAFAVWSAGVVPLALIVRSRMLATLSLLTLAAWIVYEVIELLDRGDAAALAGPLAIMLYGVALYGLGTAVAGHTYGGPMRGVGYALGAAGAFVLSFEPLHREVERDLGGTIVVVVVALAAGALVGALALVRVRGRGSAPWEAMAVVAAVALGLATAFAPLGPVPGAVLFNVLLAGVALGAVVAGYLDDELWLVNAGLAVVVVHIVARFIDFAWDLLPRSAAFLGAGLLLLALAFGLERGRSRLASRMATR